MKKFLKRTILTILTIVLLLTAGIGGAFLYLGYRYYEMVTMNRPVVVEVSHYTSEEGYVPYESIDHDFVNAVVAVEDQRYFTRKGIDYIAFFRAVYNNLRYGRLLEGGSTIGEQVAKNLYFQGEVRDIINKIAEIFVMLELEKEFSKEEILALYANMNYYGDGYWGIGEAADGYLHTGADELTIAQAALLAGIPNAPAIYQLSDGYDLAIKRQRKVLERMLEEGYISNDEYERALEEVIPKP